MHLKFLSKVSLLIAALAFLVIQCDSKDKQFQKQIEKDLVEINGQCPLKMTENLTLDSCRSVGVKMLEYYYTVTGTFDAAEIETAVKEMAKTHPEMADFRENGVSTEYFYRDKEGNIIHRFKVTPEDYKK